MVEEKTETLHEGMQFMKDYAAAEKQIGELKSRWLYMMEMFHYTFWDYSDNVLTELSDDDLKQINERSDGSTTFVYDREIAVMKAQMAAWEKLAAEWQAGLDKANEEWDGDPL